MTEALIITGEIFTPEQLRVTTKIFGDWLKSKQTKRQKVETLHKIGDTLNKIKKVGHKKLNKNHEDRVFTKSHLLHADKDHIDELFNETKHIVSEGHNSKSAGIRTLLKLNQQQKDILRFVEFMNETEKRQPQVQQQAQAVQQQAQPVQPQAQAVQPQAQAVQPQAQVQQPQPKKVKRIVRDEDEEKADEEPKLIPTYHWVSTKSGFRLVYEQFPQQNRIEHENLFEMEGEKEIHEDDVKNLEQAVTMASKGELSDTEGVDGDVESAIESEEGVERSASSKKKRRLRSKSNTQENQGRDEKQVSEYSDSDSEDDIIIIKKTDPRKNESYKRRRQRRKEISRQKDEEERSKSKKVEKRRRWRRKKKSKQVAVVKNFLIE